jgi:hypothetical protein
MRPTPGAMMSWLRCWFPVRPGRRHALTEYKGCRDVGQRRRRSGSRRQPQARQRQEHRAHLVAAVPHGHVWTAPPVQGESSAGLTRDRVLPCVRPMMRRDIFAAGPYGSSRIRSTSLKRARSARRAPGSPDPASPTLRHTCPSTSSPGRQRHHRRPLMQQRLELGRFRPW